MTEAALLTTQIAVVLATGAVTALLHALWRRIAMLEAAHARATRTATERGRMLDRIRAIEGLRLDSRDDHARALTWLACTDDLWMQELLEARLYAVEWEFAKNGDWVNPMKTDADVRRATRFCAESNAAGLFSLTRQEVQARLDAQQASR